MKAYRKPKSEKDLAERLERCQERRGGEEWKKSIKR